MNGGARRSGGRGTETGFRRTTELAQLAARILGDGEADDFAEAKRRAADYLGSPDSRDWPDNLTVLAAVIEQQRLFDAAETAERVRRKRAVALTAMKALKAFEPRLTGPVLYGTAFEHSPITLHVFCDEPEAVSRWLMERRIKFSFEEQELRIGGRKTERYPLLATELEGEPVDILVMPLARLIHAPLSPLDGAPSRRMSGDALERLLASPEAAGLHPELADLKLPPL